MVDITIHLTFGSGSTLLDMDDRRTDKPRGSWRELVGRTYAPVAAVLAGGVCCRALILQTIAAFILPTSDVGGCRHRGGLIGPLPDWGAGDRAG